VNVKVDAKTIVHKSDVGGVALDLDPEGAKAAVDEMQGKFADANPRYLVQEYVPQGTELIVGAVSEGKAGHRIVFGLGGVMVEVLKDVSFGITPITGYEAKKMITSVKSHKMIAGHRGQDGVDMEKLAELLQRVSQMVTDVPEILEMDLNPVMGYKDRVVVVDARIKIQDG
jgi:acetyltransferase